MGQAFLVCRCVNERARIPVGADSISAREVCGGARCAGAYRMRPYGQTDALQFRAVDAGLLFLGQDT